MYSEGDIVYIVSSASKLFANMQGVITEQLSTNRYMVKILHGEHKDRIICLHKDRFVLFDTSAEKALKDWLA